jgi:hypothetical protein
MTDIKICAKFELEGQWTKISYKNLW